MALTLAQLLPPFTADQVKAFLISALQGVGPVQQIGTGAGVVTVSGAPQGNYDGIILVNTAGAPGTGSFSYSLNLGLTYAGPFTIPANGVYTASGTGLTFGFSGTFASTDQYIFKSIFPPFPVTDWQSGGIARTLLEAEAEVMADLVGNALANVAGGGFVDYASDPWLPLLSTEVYNNTQYPAQTLQGLVLLTLAAGSPTVTATPGSIILGSGGGLQYSNVSGFTLTAGSSLSVLFQAAAPGAAYNLNINTLTQILTPQPGLSASNPSPGTTAVVPSGGATGTLTTGGTPNANYSVVVRVLTTGPLGTGTFQVSLDGGNNYGAPTLLPLGGGGSYPLPTTNYSGLTGLTLFFSTSTWTAGDFYTFTAYFDWKTRPGQDAETSAALRLRDKGKWGQIGTGGPTQMGYDYLCRSTPNGGSEVTKTFIQADLTVPGQVDIVVAGVTGGVSITALAAITAFVQARVPLTAKANISNAIQQSIALTGTVYVVAAQSASAQTAVGLALSQLAASIPINGFVNLAAIIAAIENQGAAGVRNVHLTAPAIDTQLASSSVPVFNLAGLTYSLV